MCGILGSLPYTDKNIFKKALDTIAHRGPDGYGIWQDENQKITLGHRRLAILDLSDLGKQPMHFGNYVITFNGEIYNFIEIKKELELKGYKFTSDTDTEIILAAYQEWREACLLKFNGMWAFAIWDKANQKLFLCRDRFGVKPLYYTFSKGKFAFASEMKALFSFLDDVRPSDDFEQLKSKMFTYESTDKCIINGIKRFPAGSYAYLDLTRKQLNITQFWNTKDHLQKVPLKYDEQVEQFRELFIDACKIRMRSDVPIGTTLSGGLDSSAIISTMAHIDKQNNENRVSKNWQHAFVATFPGTFLDEKYYAEKVVESIDIKATYLPIDPVKGIDDLGKYLYLFEELYITSPIPMMEIYKSVRNNGVVVSIDGHGADEMMSGYGNIPSPLLDCGLNFSKIKNTLNTLSGMQDYEYETNQLQKSQYNLKWYLNYMVINKKGGKNLVKYYLDSFLGKTNKENASLGQFGTLNSALYELFHKTVLPTLLRNYDRYSMANGIEVRMPFMDYRLVNFSFSLPWESKVNSGRTKSILRDAMKGILTDEVRLRKTKIGFNTPIVDWMKGAWKPFLMDTISSKSFEQSSVIDPKKVRQKVLNVMNNPDVLYIEGEQTWAELVPYLWEKNVISEYKQYQ
jgi:asparagine synthase (glutamine-hydrolysing)